MHTVHLDSDPEVVGLIIEPTPGNSHPSLFSLSPTGNKRAGNTNQAVFSGWSMLLVCTIELEFTLRGERTKMYTLALTCIGQI